MNRLPRDLANLIRDLAIDSYYLRHYLRKSIGSLLEPDIPRHYFQDHNFMFAVARANESVLLTSTFTPLLRDKQFMRRLVGFKGHHIVFADPKILDKELITIALKQHGGALGGVPQHMRDNIEYVTCAVSNNPRSLRFAAQKYRHMKDIVLLAVGKNGLALEYASVELRRDMEVVRAAITTTPRAFVHAHLSLKCNKELALYAVGLNGWLLEHCLDLQHDRDVVMAAVQQCGLTLKYACIFQGDRDVVMAAVKNNGRALQYARSKLQKDPKIVRVALENNHAALAHVPDLIQKEIVETWLNKRRKTEDEPTTT